MLTLALTDTVCDDISRVVLEHPFTDRGEPVLHDFVLFCESATAATVPVSVTVDGLTLNVLAVSSIKAAWPSTQRVNRSLADHPAPNRPVGRHL
jgi:hypothetical protein